MEREQIIKALECCVKVGGYRDAQICNDCPLSEKRCAILLPENALALINSQEQRIKELTEENERLKEQNEAKINANFSLSVLREAKADTVKKMQKIITANYAVSKVHYVENEEPTITYQLTNWQLDQIAKEMLEGEK